MIVRIATVTAVALALSSCNVLRTAETDLSFTYTAFGGDEMMDQVLEITNDGPTAVTPKLEITPLDGSDQPIEGLKVTTAYGSERGEHVLPPYFTEYDVLKFEGERAGEVRNVQVEVREMEQVDYPALDAEVTAEQFDDGRVVPHGKTFDSVELTNPNHDDVPVRVALIGWSMPRKGDPQQAEWVIPLSEETVTVPARSRKMLRLPPDLADGIVVSVKTYPATS